LAILSAFGESYVRDNEGAQYRLISHETRPCLTLVPPPSVEKRPMTFRFIDAVQRLVPNFSRKEWDGIYDKVGTRLHLGQLKKVFVVLADEDRPQASRFSGPTVSGSNAQPVGRGRGGRGGRGGRSEGLKRGLDTDGSTPAKVRRGK